MLGRLAAADVDVVSMEGDVELPEGDLGTADLCDPPAKPLGERDAARVNADERDPGQVWIALDDLVGDARQRALDRVGVEENLR
jgi:hypothetical protein